MMNSWLPPWLGLTLATVFGAIVIVHLYHVLVLTGRQRLWHGVHVLMATGMIIMFAPTGRLVAWNVAGAAVFAAAAGTVAGLLVRQRAQGHHLGTLWLIATLDLAAMVYMFAMTDLRLLWLTIALAGWFIIQATGWTTARLYTTLAHGGLGDPPPTRPTTTAPTPTPTPTGSTGNQPQPAFPHHVHRGNSHGNLIRATLAMMSIGIGLHAHRHAIRDSITARHAGHVAACESQAALC
jgi:Domain of unknown function (DUF5134)